MSDPGLRSAPEPEPAAAPEPAGGRARRSPYQGLIPYGEDDAAYFFGRDDARDVVLDNLLAYRVSVLYGPSGVGKSSLLRAGVVRHVRDEGRRRIEAGEEVEFVALAFGAWSEDPARGLKAAIGEALERLSPEHAAGLPDGTLADVVAAAAQRVDGALLIILDQFEEHFLYHAPDGPFVVELMRTLARRDVAASVLLSIREDSLALLDGLEGLLPGLLDHLVRVEHLDRDAARAAIEQPLALWSREHGEPAGIEPELVEAVLDGVQTPGLEAGDYDGVGRRAETADDGRIQTPYLQLVMSRLWDAERAAGSRTLRLRTLRELGGAEEIVSTHVANALGTLSEAERAVAARVLRQLVTPSGTKIALRAADLAENAELAEGEVTAVLERLTSEARILQATGSGRYEIYHDALARPILEWRRAWQAGQDRERQRRRNRRIALTIGGLVLIVLVVAVLGLVALRSQRDASRQASIASSVALASAARDVLAEQPDVSALLSLAALRREDRAEARNSMVLARESPRLEAAVGVLRQPADINGTVFVRGGRGLVTTGADGSVLLWDAATRRRSAAFERPPAGDPVFTRPAVSRDGRVLAAGAQDGTIALWDVASRRLLGTLPTRSRRPVTSIAFSPDGRTLASAGEEPRIRLWDVPDRSPAGALPRVDDLQTFEIAFSPDGRTLASVGSSYVVRLWDVRRRVATGRRLRDDGSQLSSLAYAADGRLAVGGEDVLLWEPATDDTERIVTDATVTDLALSSDATRLVVGYDGAIELWQLGERAARRQLSTAGPSDPRSLALAPDARTIAVAGAGGKAWLYEAARLLSPRGETQADSDIAFDRSGRKLVSVADGRIWLTDARTRKALRAPLVDRERVERIALSPDGRTLASIGAARDILLWDLRTGAVTARLASDGETVSSIAFSSDGRMLAAGGAEDEPTIVLWDVAKRSRDGRALPGHRGGVNSVAFSPGGDRLASGGENGHVGFWDVSTRRPVGLPAVRHEGAVADVAWAPDGGTLASAGADGRIWLWEVGGPPRRAVAPRGRYVTSIAFGSDGRMLVAAGEDGIRLWDVEAGRALGDQLLARNLVNAIAVSPDGTTFASADSERALRLWPRIIWPDQTALAREICRLTGSGLDDAERRRYADGIEFESTCDG